MIYIFTPTYCCCYVVACYCLDYRTMKKMVTGLMMMTITMTTFLATFPLVSSEHRQNKHNHNRCKRNCNSWNDTYIPSTYKKADNVIFGLPSIRRVVYISRGGGGGGVSSQLVKNKTQNTNKIKSVNDSKNKIIQKRNASIEDDPGLLILIRVLYFTYYASLGSLLPYLPVYYHSLGHGGQIIGMLGAIKPFTTFLVGPGWGIISDQFGCPFKVLYFTFLVSLVGQLFVAWRHDHFWIMSMVFITAFFNAPVKSLLDSLVMSNIKNSKLYGRLRLYGQLGFGVGSSAVGLILSKSQQAQQHRQALGGSTLPSTTAIIGGSGSTIEKLDQIWQTITGYKLLFFTHALLSVPTFFCMRSFDRWTKKENVLSPKNINQRQQRVVKQSRKGLSGQNKPTVLDGIRILSKNNDALLFFFLVLVVGILFINRIDDCKVINNKRWCVMHSHMIMVNPLVFLSSLYLSLSITRSVFRVVLLKTLPMSEYEKLEVAEKKWVLVD